MERGTNSVELARTREKHALTALRTSVALHRRSFETARNGILILDAKTGQVVEANPFLKNLLGYSQEEFLERKLWEIGPFKNEDASKKTFAGLQVNDRLCYEGLPLETKAGRQVGAEFISHAYEVEGTHFIQCDLREPGECSQSETNAAELAAIVASSDDAIIGKDLRGMVTSWNAGAEKIFGYSASEMIGHSIARLVPPQRMAEEGKILARIERGESVRHFETVRLRKDGTIVEVSVTVSAIKDPSGRIVGASKVARDITERKLQEKILKRSTEALERSNVELAFQVEEKAKRADELVAIDEERAAADVELAFQVEEKSKRADELAVIVEERTVANKELAFQVEEKGKRADELAVIVEERTVANKELAFQVEEKAKRADELAVIVEERTAADVELAFQVEEKGKRADELAVIVEERTVANKELAFQVAEKGKRADELAVIVEERTVANKELAFQVAEKGKRADELAVIVDERTVANKELAFQVEEKAKRADELAAINAKLTRSNEALERSNVELAQFAYIASHDLQTPLRNISGFVQLLQENYANKLDEKGRDWVRRTVQAAAQMHTLIRDVLEYSRVDSRERPFETVSLRDVFHDSVGLLEASIRDAGGEVTCDELPSVMGDRSQLVQLLQNLIGNGLKYHGEKPPHVHVSAQRDGKEWTISIRDNGIGIAPRHQERIFEIFKRLHNQQEYPGTGIGLAVCRRVVHRHGGKIRVESEAGQGSVFMFTIAETITKTH